jgi:hypothetical protein
MALLARNDLQVQKSLWRAEASSPWTFLKDVSMLVIIEIAPQVADFIFEGITMSNYFHSEDYSWLAFTLVPIFLPGILLGAEVIYSKAKASWYGIAMGVLWDGIAFPICLCLFLSFIKFIFTDEKWLL